MALSTSAEVKMLSTTKTPFATNSSIWNWLSGSGLTCGELDADDEDCDDGVDRFIGPEDLSGDDNDNDGGDGDDSSSDDSYIFGYQ